MNVSNPKSDFVHVNGIRLHYLDWGGSGPTLIFLTGMGCSAYIFNKFAPRFIDNSASWLSPAADRVIPITLKQAMTQILSQKIFVLTHFAATYPTRVEKLIYLDALDDRRELRAISEQSPLRNVEIKKEASSPHTLEEYIADFKRDIPYFAEIWSELWDEEISHGVKVNEAGVYMDKTPASVEKMMVENLINGYAPKRVEVKIPTLSCYGRRKPKLSNAYTDEQKAAFDQF